MPAYRYFRIRGVVNPLYGEVSYSETSIVSYFNHTRYIYIYIYIYIYMKEGNVLFNDELIYI